MRQGNQVTATVKMSVPDPNAPVPLTIVYDPASYVVSPPHACTAAQNSPTATFQFTVGTVPPGQSLSVTVATVGCSDPACSVTKPFPPPP
jgi:hypothetical protein